MNERNLNLKAGGTFVYVGTYTSGSSEGIYTCQLDMTSGELRQVGVTRNVVNPSYLTVDVERNRLYAVNEVANLAGRPGGAVSAFAIQPRSGALSLIGQQHSLGAAPCYLAIDRSGRYLLVANYGGGNISVIPVGDDGSLRAARVTIAHTGNSLHPQRQEGPHPHSIVLDPANNYVFVPDLGLDKVMQYRFDRANGQLSANQPPYSETIPGSGPRHLVFHPSGTKAYVINELDSTVTAYAYDSERGWFERLQTISTLPGDYSGSNLAADLHLTPDGNFLFGSNRGHDSIACYKVDQTTGWLTHLAFIQTGGRKPRGFAIDPTGSYLLAANQESHSIVTFRIDQETGMLNPTGHEARIPNPVCLKFAT